MDEKTTMSDRFASVLREARIKKGLKQEDVSRMLGKTKNVVSHWERGINKPDIDSVEILCDKLNIDIADFINISPSEPGDFVVGRKSRMRIELLNEDNLKLLESYYDFLLSNQRGE